MELTGKVAIVTGSARGLGKAIATKFASEGAAVVVSDILTEQAQQTADEIKNQGGTATFFKADVANRTDVHNLVEHTLKNFKAIHILVNNAGFAPRRAYIFEMPEEDWDIVMNVMLKGVFNCTQAVLKHMIEQKYGKIINLSSVAGLMGSATRGGAYAVAKAGVAQLTKTTAMEAGPYGINVNAIAPSVIVSDFHTTNQSKEAAEKGFEKFRNERSALHRVGMPEDIANLAMFLASDASSNITGQVIRSDSGQ
ncbi:SDR family NAD(P)-dependent oxidoreductase [Chloroflexota bacterium]